MKHIYSFFFLIYSITAFGQVTFKWLGTSGFILTDSETTIVFDPAITRIPLYDFLPFRTIQSDATEVKYWMNRCGIKTVDATFVNHAHTDHVIDAPMVVKNYGGKLYGSSSVVNVGLGQGLNEKQVQSIKSKDQIKVGKFSIEPFNTPHAPHLFNILLMDGDITTPLKTPTSAWNYRSGETHSFLIKHPKGTILFQAIGKIYDPDPLKGIKADVLFLTIANRNSSEELIQRRIIPTEAKRVIPLHFDNFFFKMRRDKIIDDFWGVNVDDFKEKMKLLSNKTQVDWPLYCEEISLF